MTLWCWLLETWSVVDTHWCLSMNINLMLPHVAFVVKLTPAWTLVSHFVCVCSEVVLIVTYDLEVLIASLNLTFNYNRFFVSGFIGYAEHLEPVGGHILQCWTLEIDALGWLNFRDLVGYHSMEGFLSPYKTLHPFAHFPWIVWTLKFGKQRNYIIHNHFCLLLLLRHLWDHLLLQSKPKSARSMLEH